MSQHLYECQRCRKYGVAHYVLEHGLLLRLCTACAAWWRQRYQETGRAVVLVPE